MEEAREASCEPKQSSPTQPSVEPVHRAAYGGRMVVICRICLSTRPRMVSIHSPVPEYDQKTLYAMLLSVCLPLNQRETIQGLPEQICRNCQWKLLSAYDLYETTLASDEQLRAQTHLALAAKIPKNPQSSEMVKPDSVPVPANVANDGLIRVKEETPDDGYEDEQQYGPGSRIGEDGSMAYDEASGEMGSTVNVHPDVSLLMGRSEQGEEEETSLLEETKPPIPDPLETFIAEHYQVDELTGGHVCGLCKRDFPYKSQCRMHIVQKHNPAKPFKCDICFCTLTSHLRLVRHKVVSHGAGQIKREDIIEGQNDSTGELTYTCPICRKVFNSSVRFKRHKNVHVVHNRPFKCEVCLYRFATKPQLTQHAKVHETKPPSGLSPGGSEVGEFPCDRCEEIFVAKRALTMHLKKVHQVYRVPGSSGRPEDRERSEYVCIICKATFARETVLNTHMKMHELLAAEKEKERRLDLERMVKQELQQQMHLSMPPLPPLSPEVIDRSACVLEPFTLGLVPVAKPGITGPGTNNNDSSSINNNSPPGGAPTGSGGFGGPSGLLPGSGSKRKIPMTPTAPPNSDMAYVCPVCDMEFDERDVLKKHQKDQHARLQVGIVSSKLGESISLNSGSSPQAKLMPRFTDMPSLKMRLMDSSVRTSKKRLRTDTSAMNYIGEPLDHDESLDADSSHITAGLMPIDDIPMSTERRSASGAPASLLPGEEPSQFQCELCHKKFPYNCYLTMHMRKNHDKSKPYGCKVCHYRFGYRGTLLRHQLIHSSQRVQPGSHGSIIFKCRICSAKFLELKQLNVHLKTHRKVADEQDANRQVQLIRCDECPQIFSDPDQLTAHMLKEHQKHHSTDDELYDSDRLLAPQQQQHSAMLMNPSSSLPDDSSRTGSCTINDLKLNSEQSKDCDTNEAFMNDNDISLIKIEPNYD